MKVNKITNLSDPNILINIRASWNKDLSILPLRESLKEIYFNAQYSHFLANNCLFDISNPITLNDKIQWTKFFDQSYDVVKCTDKIKVKEYAREKLGKDICAKVYQQEKNIESIDLGTLPNSFVIKTNHDSGTTFIVQNKNQFSFQKTFEKIKKSLLQTYGQKDGEWSYSMFTPLVFVEEYLTDENNKYAQDYKFFCGKGKVFFCHYIYDREKNTKEQIISKEGKPTKYYLDPNFKKGNNFNKPKSWKEMVEIASQLSEPFKLVRIDLYSINEKVYLGEITFWPYAGRYKGEDQKEISELVTLDTSTTLEPIS